MNNACGYANQFQPNAETGDRPTMVVKIAREIHHSINKKEANEHTITKATTNKGGEQKHRRKKVVEGSSTTPYFTAKETQCLFHSP
jgi:hypothetical protein